MRKLTDEIFTWLPTQVGQLELATFGLVRDEVDGYLAAIKAKT